MSPITNATRSEAYENRPKMQRKAEIIAFLDSIYPDAATAREIMYFLGYQEPNAVRPRLTELDFEGRVEVVGTKVDMFTNRRVACYRRVKL